MITNSYLPNYFGYSQSNLAKAASSPFPSSCGDRNPSNAMFLGLHPKEDVDPFSRTARLRDRLTDAGIAIVRLSCIQCSVIMIVSRIAAVVSVVSGRASVPIHAIVCSVG